MREFLAMLFLEFVGQAARLPSFTRGNGARCPTVQSDVVRNAG